MTKSWVYFPPAPKNTPPPSLPSTSFPDAIFWQWNNVCIIPIGRRREKVPFPEYGNKVKSHSHHGRGGGKSARARECWWPQRLGAKGCSVQTSFMFTRGKNLSLRKQCKTIFSPRKADRKKAIISRQAVFNRMLELKRAKLKNNIEQTEDALQIFFQIFICWILKKVYH